MNIFNFCLFQIIAGSHNFKNGIEMTIQKRQIILRVQHPAYRPDNAVDIEFCDAAILKVDRPFTFNQFVRKIKLPPHGYDPKGIFTVQQI